MNFLNELSIYVFFAFFMYWCADKSDEKSYEDNNPNEWNIYLTWFVLFFTLISALRWDVGSDSVSYITALEKGHLQGSATTEALFNLFLEVHYILGLHYSVGLGIMGFVQIFFITKALQRYKYIIAFMPFLLFGGRYWQDLSGAVRQMMVAAIFIWSLKFLIEKKYRYYLLSIAICVTIHQSALILLPFCIFPVRLNFVRNRLILALAVIACCLIGQTLIFEKTEGALFELMHLIGYDGYTDYLNSVLGGEVDESLKFGPMMLTYLLIPLFIIWFGPKLEEQYADKVPEFYMWYNLAFLFACGFFLVCNMSHIFIRLMLYFILPQMIMGSLLLYYFICRYKESVATQLWTIFFCCVIAINSTWDLYKAVHRPVSLGRITETTTYKTWVYKDDR